MEIKIKHISNGFIVEYESLDYEGDARQVTEVFQIDMEEIDEDYAFAKTFTALAWALSENFGIFNSKHNKWRMNLEVTKEEKDE